MPSQDFSDDGQVSGAFYNQSYYPRSESTDSKESDAYSVEEPYLNPYSISPMPRVESKPFHSDPNLPQNLNVDQYYNYRNTQQLEGAKYPQNLNRNSAGYDPLYTAVLISDL